MKLKKYLRKMAEIDADKLLNEKDEMYIQKMLQYQVPQAAVRRKFTQTTAFRAIIGSIVSAAILSVIIVPSVLVNKNHGDIADKPNDVHYNDYNVVYKSCGYSDMQSNIKYFQIENNEGYKIYLNYDSVSGDYLYYNIEYSTLFADFKLLIDINENYDLKFEIGESLKTRQLDGYVINYEKVNSTGMTPSSTVNYKGVIEIRSEIVYIEYRQLVDLGEQTFFDDVQSIVKAKK